MSKRSRDSTADVSDINTAKSPLWVDALLLGVYSSFISTVLKISGFANRDDLQRMNESFGNTLSVKERTPRPDVTEVAHAMTPSIQKDVSLTKQKSTMEQTNFSIRLRHWIDFGICSRKI